MCRLTLVLGLALALAGVVSAQDDVPEVVRILIDAGDRHRDAGRFDEAIASYREAIRSGPSVVDVYVSLGALYHARGELETSLQVFLDGLEIDAEHRDLLYNAAVVALALGRTEDASNYASRGLATNRRDVELLMVASSATARLGRLEEALAALEMAADVRSGDPRILFRLGNLYHQLDRRSEAVEAYRKAVKRDRGMVRAYYNLGAVLFEEERFDEALEAYQVALEPLEKAMDSGNEIEPIHAQAFLNLGAIYSRRAEWRQAVMAYQRAIRLAPDLARGHYNLGYALFSSQALDDADAAYRKALTIDPELPLAYLHLGQIARRRGACDEAVRQLEEGLPRFSEASELTAWRELAICRRELGDAAGVETAYRSILEIEPDDATTLVALGRDLRRQDRRDEARPLFEKARGLRPDDASVALELAVLARSEGDVATEGRLYREILDRPGAGVELWPVRLNLSLLLLRQGETATARGHLDALAKAASGRSSQVPDESRRLIATLRGLLLAVEGDERGARRQLGDVSDFAPASAALAILDARGGRSAQAVPALQEAYQSSKDGPLESMAAVQLGLAMWLAGDGEQARPYLEAGVAAFPRQPGPRAALGDIELRQGRRQQAAESFEEARRACSDRGESSAPRNGVFGVELADGGGLCGWIESSLGVALVGAAADAAAAGRINDSTWRASLDRALGLPLRPADRALALYLRGTSALTAGSWQAARRDLTAALEGDLASRLVPLARNNLGVAWAQLGNLDEAQRSLRTANDARSSQATLNLGILADEHGGDPEEALAYYNDYVSAGGARRQEVSTWIDRLRKIYR